MRKGLLTIAILLVGCARPTSTSGAHQRLEFAYQAPDVGSTGAECLYTCGFDQPMMVGTVEKILVWPTGDVEHGGP
jgi:hypothetical protein